MIIENVPNKLQRNFFTNEIFLPYEKQHSHEDIGVNLDPNNLYGASDNFNTQKKSEMHGVPSQSNIDSVYFLD